MTYNHSNKLIINNFWIAVNCYESLLCMFNIYITDLYSSFANNMAIAEQLENTEREITEKIWNSITSRGQIIQE